MWSVITMPHIRGCPPLAPFHMVAPTQHQRRQCLGRVTLCGAEQSAEKPYSALGMSPHRSASLLHRAKKAPSPTPTFSPSPSPYDPFLNPRKLQPDPDPAPAGGGRASWRVAAELGRRDGGGQDRHQHRESEGRQDHQPGALLVEPGTRMPSCAVQHIYYAIANPHDAPAWHILLMPAPCGYSCDSMADTHDHRPPTPVATLP